MKGIKQPSLLDLGEPEIDLDFPGIVRIDLGEGAWVEHLPNWLKGHQDLFETLRETTGWRRQERQMYDQVIEVPRLIAKLPDDGLGDPLVDAMGESLSKRYGVKFDSIMLAYYRDGNDSVAWHGDKLKHKLMLTLPRFPRALPGASASACFPEDLPVTFPWAGGICW